MTSMRSQLRRRKAAMANHVLFLVCITVLPVILSVAGASPSCFPPDQNALLAFKAGVFDFNEGLITWSTSKSCCSWRGVSCNSAGRVTHLSVTIEGLVVQKPRLVGSTLSDLTELEVLVLQNLVNSDDLPTPALPGELKSLRKLTTLSLVDSRFGGRIPEEWSEISSLKKLNLSLNSGIEGIIPRSFCKLRKLQVFSVGNVWVSPGRLKGHIPACFGSLEDIREIQFSNNKLTGIIPSSLKNLRKLASLKLANNMMGGPIPGSMGCLKELKVLHLQGNSFSGPIPASLWSLANLQDLELGAGEDDSGNLQALNKELSGGLPASYRLKALKILRIRGTSIAGPLPPSLGLISQKLTEITLDNNALTGRIPVSLGALKYLTTLNLASNQLKGPIPPSLARPKLSKLSIINLSGNQLSGEIPSSLSKLSLSTLDLSNNHLKGMIPLELGDALPSGMLKLGSNQLSGAFPPSLWNLRLVNLSHNNLTSLPSGHLPTTKHVGSSHLEQLFLDSNELSGRIPAWIFDLSDVLYLNLGNNKFVPPLPSIDPNSLSISYLNISRNLFTGTIPDDWANIQSLSTLDVSFNQFTGKIPANFTSGSLFFNNLVLSHNKLSGPLPDQIFSSIFFNSLDLSHNDLSGPIPDIFPDTTPFLSSLDLSFNQLSGDIPQRLFNYSAFLGKVKLSHNQFSGPIPNFSGACQPGGNNLNFVALNDNKFTGVLHGAPWIQDCAGKFTVFDISGNGITGPIPDLSSWTQLKVLSLARNKFTGPVPSFLFTDLPSLQVLDLSRNNLSGALPLNNLGGLQSMLNSTGADLKPMKGGPYYQDGLIFTKVDTVVPFTLTLSTTTAIDLSHNALSGLLSEKMGSLMGLHVFDVASNRLSGSLPSSLGKIKGLQILDLSNNAFTGIIPPSLQSFPASSFSGNAGLCGRPLAEIACLD